MYKTRIATWSIERNNKKEEKLGIYRVHKERECLGKQSVFWLRGHVVDLKKVEMQLRRAKALTPAILEGEILPDAPTPSDLVCFTPRSNPSPEATGQQDILEIDIEVLRQTPRARSPVLSQLGAVFNGSPQQQGCLQAISPPEKALATIVNYLEGKIDSGCWFWDHGILAKEAKALPYRQPKRIGGSSEDLTSSCSAAVSLFMDRRFEEGGTLLRASLRHLQDILRGQDPFLLSNALTLLSTWSSPSSTRHNFSQVQQLILQAFVNTCHAVLTAQHPLTIVFEILAVSNNRRQLIAQASQTITGVFESRLGAHDDSAIDVRLSFAEDLVNTGDAQEAEKALLPLIDFVDSGGPCPEIQSRVHGYLGHILYRQGRYQDAVNALSSGLEADARLDDPELTCDRLLLLHKCESNLNNSNAEGTLRRAVDLAAKMVGQGHSCTIRLVATLENFLRGLGRCEEADAIVQLHFGKTVPSL